MNTNARLRALLQQQPFVPFTIEMANGRTHEIKHPDFIQLPPERFDRIGHYITIWEETGVSHGINPNLVARITPAVGA